MKKIILSILICVFGIWFSAVFVYSQGNITENAGIKIVINGKASTYKNIPVTMNGRTLLPLRELLVNLGVQNDDEHIIWDGKNRSVTVLKDPIKFILYVDSNITYVNDEQQTIDVPPVIYKDRVYIPARFVSQCLGKKVTWNGKTNTAAICDQDNFDKVHEIIFKSDTALNSIKFRNSMSMDIDVGGVIKSTVTVEGEHDPGGKLEHRVTKQSINGVIKVTEYYAVNGVVFEKTGTGGNWERLKSGKGEGTEYLDLSSENLESISAGFVINENSNNDEIVLEGDIGLTAVFNSKNDPHYKVHTIFKFDRNTYLIKEVSFKMEGIKEQSNAKFRYTLNAVCKFYDFDDSFEIILPQKISAVL